MNKKLRFWMYAVSGIVLTVIVAWSCRSEYGNGYSEDQRRNWNEMVTKAENDPGEFFMIFSDSSVLTTRQSLSDVPDWKLEFPKEPVKLPLEGLSILSLVDLADRGDGDACLELVFRTFNKESGVESIGAVFQWEKYINKAVEAGRPGADFLLRLLDEWKKRGKDVKGENVTGYSAFLSHLDAGDFLLGKVYFYLNPKDVSGLDKLAAGLERKAERGDVAALRNSGHLGVLKIAGGEELAWTQSFYNQRGLDEKDVRWLFGKMEKTCALLPVSVQPTYGTIVELWKKTDQVVTSWRLKRARRSLNQALRLLLLAAERGDLHAKFLWTQYSGWGVKKFSRKEWETHLKYVDDLMKAGGDYPGNNPVYVWSRDILPVESFFYKNRKEVLSLVDEKRNAECEAFFPDAGKSPENTLDISSSLRMEVEAKCDMSSFVDSYMRDVLRQPMEKTKEMVRGLQLMKQSAEEGNPFALYGLARLLNEGIIVDQDGRKAWELLQRFKAWREGIHEKHLSDMVVVSVESVDRSGNVTRSISGCDLDGAVDYQMLDIVANHGDMPGMTVKLAFDQFVRRHIEKQSRMKQERKDHLKNQFEKRGYKVPDEKSK